jgi:hypothetical protein
MEIMLTINVLKIDGSFRLDGWPISRWVPLAGTKIEILTFGPTSFDLLARTT